jgi:hypothetical protein
MGAVHRLPQLTPHRVIQAVLAQRQGYDKLVVSLQTLSGLPKSPEWVVQFTGWLVAHHRAYGAIGHSFMQNFEIIPLSGAWLAHGSMRSIDTVISWRQSLPFVRSSFRTCAF